MSQVSELKSKILVVDDDPENLHILLEILKDSYAIVPTTNGRKALELAAKTPQPDLILLDVMMPEMDGYQICDRLKQDPKTRDIPVIFVTALSETGNETQGFDLGAVDYITKPLSPPVVQARIKSHLTLLARDRQLQAQNIALKNALQLRQDISNMVIHDLRNPLTTILLGCNLLERTGVTPQQQTTLEQINQEARTLESLIDSLLITAKLEAGKLLLNCQPTDLNYLVRETLDRFQLSAEQHQVQLEAKLIESEEFYEVDRGLVRRLIENLLSNAIKFAPKQSVVQLVTSCPTPETFELEVCDSGPGIPEDKKRIIFEKYEIADVMEQVPQIGLGLAFCKMVTESHGGQITVTDHHPQGSVFKVVLPRNSSPLSQFSLSVESSCKNV